MGAFDSVWDDFRARGYIAPEYDQPIGNFGTVVEREVDALKEALDLEDSEMTAETLLARVKALREGDDEVRKKLALEVLELDDDGTDYDWDFLVKAFEGREDELARALGVEEWDSYADLVETVKQLTRPKVVGDGPTPADWEELRLRAERAEAAGSSLGVDLEKMKLELDEARGAATRWELQVLSLQDEKARRDATLDELGEKAERVERLVRTGCDEVQAALGFPPEPKVGWHELVAEVRVRTKVYAPGAALAPAYELGRQAAEALTPAAVATETSRAGGRRPRRSEARAALAAAEGRPGPALTEGVPRRRRSEA